MAGATEGVGGGVGFTEPKTLMRQQSCLRFLTACSLGASEHHLLSDTTLLCSHQHTKSWTAHWWYEDIRAGLTLLYRALNSGPATAHVRRFLFKIGAKEMTASKLIWVLSQYSLKKTPEIYALIGQQKAVDLVFCWYPAPPNDLKRDTIVYIHLLINRENSQLDYNG